MKQEIDVTLLESLSRIVEQKLGLHFPEGKYKDLTRALSYAADDLGYDDASSCAKWLLFNATEKEKIATLVEYLTIGETYFFRDGKIFDGLTMEIIPEILERRGSAKQQSLRIWSAASSSGEEAYSIAMSMKQIPHLLQGVNVSILATDINKKYLAKARTGKYSNWSFRGVPQHIISSYFTKIDKGHHLLHGEIREMVKFSHFNLATGNFPSFANLS